VTGGSGGLPSSGGSPSEGGGTASGGGLGVVGGSSGAGTGAGGTGGTAGTSDTGGTSGVGGAGASGAGGTSGAGAGGTGGASTSGAGGTSGAGTSGAGGVANMVVLFDGSNETFDGWTSVERAGVNPWRNNGDGTMTVLPGTGDIQSKQKFRNVFVHVEYLVPQTQPNMTVGGGVFLNGSYGLRIADSYGLEPTVASCGAVYALTAPLEVACHELGVWNTYEIEFQAPTCDDESQPLTPARFVEVTLNGTLIHRNVDVLQKTEGGQAESCEPQGLLLQDVVSLFAVSFRNIWAIPRN
jgi:hypothetical protein